MKLYTFDSKTLKYKHFSIRERLVRFTLLIFIAFLVLGIAQAPVETKYITNTEKVILIEDYNIFSEELLIEEISKLDFKFPHIVLAQAILETGTYESKIFKENHNLFGMKEARVRLNLAKGTQYGHAYYDNWKESLTDYALWYSTFAYKCKNEKQLYKLLNKQYAEANYYPQALQRIIEREQLKQKFNK
mgnify:FL=1|jgi:uncharacterized FlgJ-related protein